MPTCAAKNCKKRSTAKVHMCYFPSNAELRRKWIVNVGRKDWTPNKHSALCEYHFGADAFEKEREDGTKKLKRNAIPTIFGELVIQVSTKSRKDTECSEETSDLITSKISYNKQIPEGNKISQISLLKPTNTRTNVSEKSYNEEETNNSSAAELLNDTVTHNDPRNNTEVTELIAKCEKIEQLYKKSIKSNAIMKRTFKKREIALRRKINRLEQEVSNNKLSNSLSTFFDTNQIKYMSGQLKRMPKWCDRALIQGYRLKFTCGYSGYRELLNQGFPLPSIRTLTEKLEKWIFTSGISEEIFKFLHLKIQSFKSEKDNDCLIVLDEINITSGVQYDATVSDFIGYVTLPDHNSKEFATHGLVFMLAGISHRWKQTVAFYFTGNSTDGSKFKDIIFNIISKAENIGLIVYGVVSDMGAPNQAMWKAFDISVSRYSTIKNKCAHPFDESRHLYFFHDVSHGITNFKEGMLNNKTVKIPESFVKKYNLPTNTVDSKYFQELLDKQKDLDFLLAPKLKDDYLDRSKYFQKMRVPSASNVLSHEVSTSLQFLSEVCSIPEYKATAWLAGYTYGSLV